MNQHHVYSSWEGDPATAVQKSKHASQSSTSVFSSPPSSLPTTPSPIHSDVNTATTPAKSSSLNSHNDSVFIGTSPEHNDESAGTAIIDPGTEEVDSQSQRAMLENQKDIELATAEERDGRQVMGHVTNGGTQVDICNDNVHCHGNDTLSSGEKTLAVSTTDALQRSHSDSLPAPVPSLSTTTLGTKPTSTTSSVTTTKTIPVAPGGHKGRRSPFSRKFTTPIVVTHTRRSYTKSLPKNLDPKSTVTLLLSSSTTPSSTQQQKHGKHKNQKSSFKRQFSPSRNSAAMSDGAQEEGLVSSTVRESPSSSSSGRLKGREKERELWRKRFNNSSSSNNNCVVMTTVNIGPRDPDRNNDELGDDGGGSKMKRSPEELSAIQSRVRESLRAQGVVR